MTTQPKTQVLSIGEALIDRVSRPGTDTAEFVGGSILNVAVGLAQLGHDSTLAAWWGPDERGNRLAEHCKQQGVRTVPGVDGAQRTTLAEATLDEQGRATYEFDILWDVPPISNSREYGHLHTGSMAATIAPGADKVLRAVKEMSLSSTISYDPNIRPAIMESPSLVRDRIEQIVRFADVVKASDEDLQWLYPDTPVEEVMRRWLREGVSIMITTRGPWGAYVMLKGERDMLVIDPLDVELADTVGAGDSFMAGLLSALLDTGLLGSSDAKTRLRSARWSDVTSALHIATITSGLTVSHNGAFAPSREDVDEVIAAHPELS